MNYVQTIDLKFSSQMLADLTAKGFEITKPPYTLFSARKKGVSCTLYTSGKLVIQGSEKDELIEFYIEPLLGSFSYTHPKIKTNEEEHEQEARIGIDESGKGDFFGPLCIAGVYAKDDKQLKEMGVKDSKLLSDTTILKIAKRIRAECTHHIVKINPLKYNELYAQFKNLNTLLAWGHATVIEHLVAQTSCPKVIVDQFANPKVVLTALKRKNLKLDLCQRHRAEEDLIVAAASILARETFLLGLESLSKEYGIKLPKGASKATIEAGRCFVQCHGREALVNVGKLHFKTSNMI